MEIGGAQVSRATRVEPIIVSCAKGSVSISNVIFIAPEQDAQPWYAWLDDFVVAGHNDPSHERTGELALLDPSLSRDVFRIALSKLGIVRVGNVVSKSNAAVISRVAVEMYCGGVAIQVPGALPKPTGSTRAAAPGAAEGEALAGRLHELVSSLGSETAHLTGRALAARLLSSTMLSTQDSVGGSWAREMPR